MLFRLHNLEADELLQATGFISSTAGKSLCSIEADKPASFIPYADVKVDEKIPFRNK